MSFAPRFALLACALASTTMADITVTADILNPGEGQQPPPRILIIDILVDVTPGDEWIAAGLRAQATSGATFVYARDPNEAIVLINPGAENRFVTSLSRPRARDAA